MNRNWSFNRTELMAVKEECELWQGRGGVVFEEGKLKRAGK